MEIESIKKIIEQQRTFFDQGKSRSISFRLKQLQQLKKALHRYEKEIIQALHHDLQRPAFETYIAEIFLCIQEINNTIINLKHWAKPQGIITPLTLFPGSSYVYHEPYGLVLIMAPWNFPIQLCLMPLIGALAGGNCAIIKPSEFAPHASTLLCKLIQETFAPELVSCIEGDVNVAQTLLGQPFDYIFFTGSTRVGKLVIQAAAKHVTPLTLELGGKNPCIIDTNINLDIATKKIVWGKYYNAGQNCIAPDYVLIPVKRKELLVEKLIYYIKQLYGNDAQKSSSYGRIINKKHFDRLLNLLEDNPIIYGGSYDEYDLYIEPTVLDEPSLEQSIMQEEIFGPLLPIITYEKFEEALAIVHKLSKPLVLYFFSNNKQNQQKILNNTRSGQVGFNDVLIYFSNLSLPFGGIGLSGFGNYHGKANFETFSQTRSVFYSSKFVDPIFRYPPYNTKQRFIKKILSFFER